MEENKNEQYTFAPEEKEILEKMNLVEASVKEQNIQNKNQRELIATKYYSEFVVNTEKGPITLKNVFITSEMDQQGKVSYHFRWINENDNGEQVIEECLSIDADGKVHAIGDLADYLGEELDIEKFVKSNDLENIESIDDLELDLDEEYIDPNTGEYVWIPKNIDKIRKCFNYKDCFVTKKLEEFDGALFNLTVLPNSKNNPKGKTEAKIPVNKHRADVEKYGGFSGLNPFALAVEGDKVGKKKIEKIRVVENLPLVFKNLTEQEQIAYLYNNGEKMKGLKNIHIIKPLKKNQLFELNGGYYYLASASEWNNAIELILSLDSQKKLFDVNKAISRNDYKSLDENSLLALFDEIVYKMEKHYPLLINATNLFKKSRDKFNTYSILERCDLINKILYGLSAGKEYIAIQYKDFKLSAFGRLNGKTTCLDEIILIDQSITGYYERRYKL